jgi:hypothetical protein
MIETILESVVTLSIVAVLALCIAYPILSEMEDNDNDMAP